MTKFLVQVVVNTVFAACLYIYYRDGYLITAWENDIAYVIPTIVVVFFVGVVAASFDNFRAARYCAAAMLGYGFLGTMLGIWVAFSSIEASQVTDTSAVANTLATLIAGLGNALWTTIVGAYLVIPLGANIVARGDES